MTNETMTTWNVPVASIPYLTNALEEYASRELFQQHYEEVEDTMYCIRGVRKDYEDIQAQYAKEEEQ